MNEANMRNLTDAELCRMVDRGNPEVRHLAERLDQFAMLDLSASEVVSLKEDLDSANTEINELEETNERLDKEMDKAQIKIEKQQERIDELEAKLEHAA